MGQKINPIIARVNITRSWDSKWYVNKKNYCKYIISDIKVRDYLMEKLKKSSVSRITIERLSDKDNKAKIIIHTARPGIVIGKKGGDIEILNKKISTLLGIEAQISIEEIKKPELDAKLVAINITGQLERRMMYRRVVKNAIDNTMRNGAKGIKVMVGGRLNGVEIARTEWYREGRIPLHTFRADIDYGTDIAHTQYGVIGVKVWIFKGEVFSKKNNN